MPEPRPCALLLALALCAAARPAAGQIDPQPRQLLQAGLDQGIDGRGPAAGYVYYYLNKPRFFRPNQTLRLVVAPVYADSELGLGKALGPKTDLGIGLAGGALADGHSEMRQNLFVKADSFRGDGGRAALSLYHHLPPCGPVPLAGILRVEGHYAKFTSNKGTDPSFVLPGPQSEVNVRAGLRLGGKEPVLSPIMAMEVSAWHEGRYRLSPTAYGIDGDRRIEPDSQLFWGRALLIYDKPSSAARFIAGLSGGTSIRADRFSAYRLGGNLPMASEFPLSLPGYYYEEISAGRFALLGGSAIVPLSRDRKTWTASVTAASALVDYPSGFVRRGKSSTGIGVGAAYASPSRSWQVLSGYGYGIDAARGHGNAGHTLSLFVQFDFRSAQPPVSPSSDRP